MSDQLPIQLSPDDKITPALAYLQNQLVIGQLFSKQAIRVHTWLRSGMVPEHFRFLNAQVLLLGSGEANRMNFSDVYIPVSEILMFQVLPPASHDIEPDYDSSEPNREMKAVTALCHTYRVDGNKRISALSDFAASLAVSGSQSFEPLYDATVSHPTLPSLKPIKSPYVLLRLANTSFMLK